MIQEADVRTVRKKLGLSQEKLAEKLGVTRNTISRWELGEVSPSAENLTALNRLLTQLEDPAAPKAEPPPPPDALDPVKAKRWPLVLTCVGIVFALLIAAGLTYYFTVIYLPPNRLVLEDAEIIKVHIFDDVSYDSLEIMRNGKHEEITIRSSAKIYDRNGKRISIGELEVGQHITANVENLMQYEPWNTYLTCYKIVVQ